MRTNIILYVKNQSRSCEFYRSVLQINPELDVPGMTEFRLNEKTVLGLMPETGIKRLLGDALPDVSNQVPRAEIYLTVDNPALFHQRALEMGGIELSPLLPRNWGDEAAYSLDPDSHVLVFARQLKSAR
ncbi:MAG: glyoxalase [Candidatus Riflebacteria bacterium]